MPLFALVLAAIVIGAMSCVLGMLHHPAWFLLAAVLVMVHKDAFVLFAFVIFVTAFSVQ